MGDDNDRKAVRLIVEVSDDHLEALVRVRDPDDPVPLTADEVLSALGEAKIAVTDEVRGKVDAFLQHVQSSDEQAAPFLIAKGRAAEEGKPGDFTISETLGQKHDDPDEEDPVDYYSFNTIITVEQGTVIGRLVPATLSRPGRDVFGKSLDPGTQPKDIEVDATVRRSNGDPQVLIASVPGRVCFEKRCVGIKEVIEIPGDVDFECGNIDASIDVAIKGTVLDNFQVKSKKSIKVGGTIQAADVEAGIDVLVHGGIVGRGKGKVRAEGQILAKFAEEANLRAQGPILVTKELMNCQIHTLGRCVVARGAIIGGETYAREGVEAGAIGSEAGVPTSIIVGVHPDVLAQADALEQQSKAKLKAIEKIRQTVQPLLANLKRLNPDQKERATELLFKADAMAAEIAEAEARRDRMIEEARAPEPPAVLVTKVIHAGTRIRIGRRHVIFQYPLKGPLKIEKRKVKNVTEFVAVSQASGSVTPLKSAEVVNTGAGVEPTVATV